MNYRVLMVHKYNSSTHAVVFFCVFSTATIIEMLLLYINTVYQPMDTYRKWKWSLSCRYQTLMTMNTNTVYENFITSSQKHKQPIGLWSYWMGTHNKPQLCLHNCPYLHKNACLYTPDMPTWHMQHTHNISFSCIVHSVPGWSFYWTCERLICL